MSKNEPKIKLQQLYDSIRETSLSGWGIVHRVGNSASFEEFQAFIEQGEMPAISLTDSEMGAIQGGGRKKKCTCDEAEVQSDTCEAVDSRHDR